MMSLNPLRSLPILFQMPFLLVPILLTAGCGRFAPPLTPVHGKVYYKGMPVGGGTVVFTPNASMGSAGPLARAETQTDGTFVLKTGDLQGAPPGWYRVSVMAMEPLPPIVGGQPYAVPRSLLPDRYRDPEMSGLSCEIKPGLDNGVTFNLE